MAWLEINGDGFRIGFRFGGKKHHFRLDTTNQKEANATLGLFESNFRLIEQGVIEPPPDGVDLGTYIVSGGKHGLRPSQVERAELKSLADLFDHYLAHYPKGAKEATTRKTERIHVGHSRRHLDTKLLLIEVTTRTLQAYVEARGADEVRPATIKKEIGTFAAIWNKWG